MTREERARQLQEIRTTWQDASTGWEGDSQGARARLIPQHEPEPVLTFDPYAGLKDIKFVLSAHTHIGFLLAMLEQAFAEIRRLRDIIEPPAPPARDYAADCAIHCNKPAFQKYLFEVHGLENPDSARSATKVRFLLAIASRIELNERPEAAEAWKRLKREFNDWMKR